MLSKEQSQRLRTASQSATGRGGAWCDGGVLAQLALLEGAAPADLERWDAHRDEEGPVTVRRLQESGNAFLGWPLHLLEALEDEWRESGDRSAMLQIIHGWDRVALSPPQEPTEDKPVSPARDEPVEELDRRRGTLVSFDVRQLLSFAALLTALISGLGYVMQLRNDTRDTALKIIELNRQLDAHAVESKQRYEALTARVADIERAKLLFCAARSAEGHGETLPNIGC